MGTNEEWKDIEDFEGYYQISNLGRVKSLPKTMGNENNLSPERIMKLKIDRYGYECVTLCCQKEKGKRKYKTVHRLVATAFIDNPYGLPQINHMNGNKKDNFVDNLTWSSAKENVQHAWDTGLNEKSRVVASEIHGYKCKLININSKQEVIFNSQSQLSLYLGYNLHWLSSAIRNGINYEQSCLNKGYLIELEDVLV